MANQFYDAELAQARWDVEHEAEMQELLDKVDMNDPDLLSMAELVALEGWLERRRRRIQELLRLEKEEIAALKQRNAALLERYENLRRIGSPDGQEDV